MLPTTLTIRLGMSLHNVVLCCHTGMQHVRHLAILPLQLYVSRNNIVSAMCASLTYSSYDTCSHTSVCNVYSFVAMTTNAVIVSACLLKFDVFMKIIFVLTQSFL